MSRIKEALDEEIRQALRDSDLPDADYRYADYVNENLINSKPFKNQLTMKREELKLVVIDVIAHSYGCDKMPEEIKESDRLQDDLGCDSLDFVELSMDLEKRLEISLPDADLEGKANSTVAEFIDFLLPYVAEKD